MEWLIFGFIALVILGAIFKPRRCDVCNASFKRKHYTWEIGGKKTALMPNLQWQNGKKRKRQ
ncbi:Uncharacterised protein [Yersinia pseudotuberculosis]|uniref:hypothetical protein n=1 Tax=Yersinia pseudotuberculosis TaxID=633 RepID=UPI0005E9F8F5|nr:hypothetical protein [Yersinia pseudotuberculosis]CNL65571.1 Uncharacterised protein [Yersinia pseudotuberculosis]